MAHAQTDADDPERTYIGYVSMGCRIASLREKTVERSPLRHPGLAHPFEDALTSREIDRIVARLRWRVIGEW